MAVVTSGEAGGALACGAEAVMVGRPMRFAQECPAGGQWWATSAAHPKLPRGRVEPAAAQQVSMEELLFGPAHSPDGEVNLFGALRRVMAKSGYRDLKEFQKVGLVIS